MGSGFTDKILTAMEKLPKFQFYPPLCQPWHQHSFLDNFAFKKRVFDKIILKAQGPAFSNTIFFQVFDIILPTNTNTILTMHFILLAM